MKNSKLPISQILREINFNEFKSQRLQSWPFQKLWIFILVNLCKFLGLKLPIYKFFCLSILREINFYHSRAANFFLVISFFQSSNFAQLSNFCFWISTVWKIAILNFQFLVFQFDIFALKHNWNFCRIKKFLKFWFSQLSWQPWLFTTISAILNLLSQMKLYKLRKNNIKIDISRQYMTLHIPSVIFSEVWLSSKYKSITGHVKRILGYFYLLDFLQVAYQNS